MKTPTAGCHTVTQGNKRIVQNSTVTDLCFADHDLQFNPISQHHEQQGDEDDEYEDIDDYEMQHLISSQVKLPSHTEKFTSLVSDLMTNKEEEHKAQKLTSKSIKVTKSLHNLKYDTPVAERETSAHFARRTNVEKSTIPKRRLSSGEYFTDELYFRRLGAIASPPTCGDTGVTLYPTSSSKKNDQNVQKPKVKTDGELCYSKENCLESHMGGYAERSKDKGAQNLSGPPLKHDESFQKSQTKKNGGSSLGTPKYYNSEDFLQLNNTVFPIPKVESRLDAIIAAKNSKSMNEGAAVVPATNEVHLHQANVNAVNRAKEYKPLVPEKDMVGVQRINGNTLRQAKERSDPVFIKNLLSIQQENANVCGRAKEETFSTPKKNAIGIQQTNATAPGRVNVEKSSMPKQNMTEIRDNTDGCRCELYRQNSLKFCSNIHQTTGPVTQLSAPCGTGSVDITGQRAHLPAVRRMKSEGYALARNDPLAGNQRTAHTPPPSAMHFRQVTGQGATSGHSQQRVMFGGDSSAETSSHPGAVSYGATVSNGSSSRADNSDSGSVSLSQNLPPAVRFPPQVYGGYQRVLRPDNGRPEFAPLSSTYIYPHPLPVWHQNPFITPPNVRAVNPGHDNLLRYGGIGPCVRGNGQAGRRDERGGDEIAKLVRDQVSRIEEGRGRKDKEIRTVASGEADEAESEYYENVS